MATSIGEAIIKLRFDTKSLDASQKEAASKIDKTLGALGTTAKTAGKAIAGGIAVASATVAGLAGASVKAYGDFEQLEGGMQKIFDGVDYNKIKKDALDAYASMNISASQYMEQMAGVGATFAQTMGDQKGYDTAKKGMQALADYASGTGKSVDTLMDKYQAITRSSSGYLSIADQFAGILPQTTDGFLKAAQQAGYLGKEYTKLSQVPVDQYQQALTNLLEDGVEKMGLMGNTSAESEKTITGSIAAMKSSWENLMAGLANPDADIDQLADTLLKNVETVAQNLAPAITRALKALAKVIAKELPNVIRQIPALIQEVLPDVLQAGVELFNGIIAYLPELTQTLVDLIGQLSQALIPQIPTLLMGIIDAIIGVIKTLIQPQNIQMVIQTAIQLFMALVQAIPDIVVALVEALPDIIVAIIDFMTDPANLLMIIDAAVQLFMGLVLAVPKILNALFKAFGDLFGKLWERCQNLFKDFAANFGEAISGVFKGAVNGVLGFIEGLINGPIDIINTFADGINWVLAGLTAGAVQIGKLGHVSLPRLAEGGVVSGSTIANIGEDGKEAVIPLERNTDNWAGLLAQSLAEQFEEQGLGGQGITVYMTNNINNNLDADEIGQRLMTSIRRAA